MQELNQSGSGEFAMVEPCQREQILSQLVEMSMPGITVIIGHPHSENLVLLEKLAELKDLGVVVLQEGVSYNIPEDLPVGTFLQFKAPKEVDFAITDSKYEYGISDSFRRRHNKMDKYKPKKYY